MPYKQNPKSPILKALVGNQHKLPQHLQDAIKAAPEAAPKSAAKKSGPGGKKPKAGAKKSNLPSATVNAARQLLNEVGINDPNISPSNVLKYAKKKGLLNEARSMAKQGLKQNEDNFTIGDSSKKKYL